MKAVALFTVLFVAFAVVTARKQEAACYKDVDKACTDPSSKRSPDDTFASCTANYGHINVVMKDLIKYANSHIVRSYEYLLMSSYFGNYKLNRHGFEKLFRGLSDEKWEESIELIKHITLRGGEMKFSPPNPNALNRADQRNNTYELYEIASVAKALDIEKELAHDAFDIHKEASRRSDGQHDAEISSYLEKEFVHEQAETIRKLAGYVTDMNKMLNGGDKTLAFFLFDEYLQKQ